MAFEKKALRVIMPLDFAEGVRYTEPVCDYVEDDDIDQIFKRTVHDEDWINPTADGWIMWDRDKSCTLD